MLRNFVLCSNYTFHILTWEDIMMCYKYTNNVDIRIQNVVKKKSHWHNRRLSTGSTF
jgi:hypothetical protein